MIDKWDERFMGLAYEARAWVKGPDLGVGACLVRPDKRGISLGYSGLPRGFEDTDQRITEPEFKDDHLVHAELNAILNASQSVVGWTMYTTRHPCSQCASAIIQSGIIRVVSPKLRPNPRTPPSRWEQSCAAAHAAFEEAGIVFECSGHFLYISKGSHNEIKEGP